MGYFVTLALLGFLSCALAQDHTCPAGKSRKVIKLGSGGVSVFKTQNGSTYAPKTNCMVKYVKLRKCPKLEMTCSSFSLGKGDSVMVKVQKKKNKFTYNSFSSVSATTRAMIVNFRSNKKQNGAGAECTIACSDAGVTTVAPPTAVPSDCKCGIANRATKIVGGQNTEVNEYPWQAGMVSKGGSYVWCGASVVSSRWVLTAAHCTAGETPNSIQVLLGDHKYTVSTETNSLRMNIAAIKDHESYNKNNLNNDFSMLKLASAIDFAAYPNIRPACLPPDDSNTYAGETATVTGWGTTSSGGSTSNTLNEVDVTVLTNDDCGNSYGYWPSDITNKMLCANVDGGGKDSCQGDSGGPLVSSVGGNGVTPGQNYYQIGVVSWGIGCADADYPGVYARVSKVLSWINGHMASAGETCPAS